MNSFTSAMGVPPCAKLTQGKGIETCMPGRWKPAATGQRQTVHKPLPGRCSLRWQLCLPAGISQYCQGTWGCSTTCEMTTFCNMSPFFLLINTHSKENKWFDVGNAQTFFESQFWIWNYIYYVHVVHYKRVKIVRQKSQTECKRRAICPQHYSVYSVTVLYWNLT